MIIWKSILCLEKIESFVDHLGRLIVVYLENDEQDADENVGQLFEVSLKLIG